MQCLCETTERVDSVKNWCGNGIKIGMQVQRDIFIKNNIFPPNFSVVAFEIKDAFFVERNRKEKHLRKDLLKYF